MAQGLSFFALVSEDAAALESELYASLTFWRPTPAPPSASAGLSWLSPCSDCAVPPPRGPERSSTTAPHWNPTRKKVPRPAASRRAPTPPGGFPVACRAAPTSGSAAVAPHGVPSPAPAPKARALG